MGKTPSARQEALLNYIMDYMLEYNGRAPTLNDMLRDQVGQHTEAGAITSKSVLRYNLKRLEERGQLGRIDDGSSRNLVLPGSLFTIPLNIIEHRDLEDCEIILFDVDDFIDGRIPPLSLDWVKSFVDDDDKLLFTISTLHEQCDAWLRMGLGGFHHIYKRRPFQVLNEIVYQGYNPDTVAVISEQHGMRLAALGFGLALYQHEPTHGIAPNTEYHTAEIIL